ncbi:MAG TPA: glycosyltransferase family 4 protein [Lacipirellulaceae bacterium]|nr:glycosyltransferase family 4 protein [Lacipirellulaceae bacterium]
MHTFPAKCRLPRRVLQVITPPHLSAAATQLARVTPRLIARGHAVTTVICRRSPVVDALRRDGLVLRTLPISSRANPIALAALRRAAREHRADLIHSAESSASWWSGWLECIGGPPSIGHLHEFTSAKCYQHQSHLLAVSRAVKQHLVKQGIPAARITILPNALSPGDFYATRDPSLVRVEHGADPDTPVVGTFAPLSHEKGLLELFAAIPAVLRELPHAQFWIVGQGPLWHDLHEVARQSGVFDNVRFLGCRHDVPDLTNAVDVVAIPSWNEPCGSAYVAAALMRKPTVACRSGAAPESIEDGQTGLLVSPRNSSAIADALLAILTNRDRAAQMGQAAYDRSIEFAGWDRFVHTLEQVYERVLDERPTRRTPRPTSRTVAKFRRTKPAAA